MHSPIRPSLFLLGNSLVDAIIDEAFEVLEKVGVMIENPEVFQLLSDGGARATGQRIFLPRGMVESALATAPSAVTLYDCRGENPRLLAGENIHFDPGSAALRIFDHSTQTQREATTADLVKFHRLVDRLENITLQSTGLVSSDVPSQIADAHRLWIALQNCVKPIVTGIFTVEGFGPMFEMLAIVRGSGSALRAKPLAVFDACPSPPLKWSTLTAQSVLDCARAGIPSEFVAMPMTGATAPVTLTGAVVQHTAENLSGIVFAQLAQPGAPVIFGGSPAAFDMRAGTLPMGAIETMMIDVAYAQIGKALNLPTHAYMGLSDSKCVDVQAGLETGMGAVLAALAGINVISGPGMLDYENCQSLEKLVIDNEICGMTLRLVEGIRQREEPMALQLLAELVPGGGDFLTSAHTLRWLREEHRFPRVIDRGNTQQWLNDGRPTLPDRASHRVTDLLTGPPPEWIAPDTTKELRRVMESYARRNGMENLPLLPVH